MALVAYKSLLSLYHVLGQLQHSSWRWLIPCMRAIKALQKQVRFMQESLEIHSNSQRENDQIEDMARQIAEFANEAEDIIDSSVVHKLQRGFGSTCNIGEWSLRRAIEKVFLKIFWLNIELKTLIKEGEVLSEEQAIIPVPAGPSTLPSDGDNNTMVGFDEELDLIMKELTGGQPDLVIIPITGMGGIGKTTLARNAFENKCVVEHFDVSVWITISQKYNVQEILLGVLRDIGVDIDDLKSEKLAKLREKLYKQLYGKMYLIVMDDMWSTKAWDDFKSSFQDCENGSRIIVTTRLSDVVVYLGSRSPYFMKFLDEVKSWNLFCEKVFAHESCPPELEEPGKEIVKSCRGLPLTIVVIGGFLAKYNRIPIYWESVAENVKLYANLENDEQFSKIIALSYRHLPIHLKPCFLYMRVFPEDHDIRVSELVNLWIAEGCLKPLRGKNLEETAEEYLKDLIARNLILIRKQGRTGKIKICGIHDLLRDLCIKESDRENFFCVLKVQHIESGPQWDEFACSLCHDGKAQDLIELTNVFHGLEVSLNRNLRVCKACKIMHSHHKRLKVTSAKLKFAKDASVERLLLTTLRYLTFKDFGEEVVARIPNMKKLRIFYSSSNSFRNLALLSKLESLYLEAGGIYSSDMIAFPHSLKKLELSCCRMDWEDMTIIGSLPNLEVLKLRSNAFEGREWNPVEGEFLRLKFLLIGSTNLKCWRAEDFHFPCLETLALRLIYRLEEIPSGIGEIGTLRLIELIGCSRNVIDSAEQIIEEQQSMGNEDLQLNVSDIQRARNSYL